MTKQIKILIIEDQTLMRQGLKTILDLEPGLTVIGEAENGQVGVNLALKLRPDIILMDVQMPELNGVEATAVICAVWPTAKIIILTTFDRDDYVFEGIRAGAMGYLLKDTPATELINIIRQVDAGEPSIQPEIASRALRELIRPLQTSITPLSPREQDVMQRLAQGATNREIAAQLHISVGTAKNHVSNILGKLQAENRTHAADIARRYGMMNIKKNQ